MQLTNLLFMSFFRLSILFSLLLITTSNVIAQSGQLDIRIMNPDNESLPGATIQLFSQNSGLKKYAVTDPEGVAVLKQVKYGNYVLKISFMGYKTLEEELKVNSASNSLKYELKPDALNLKEVAVVAKKPVIRQEDDKMIIDPESLATTTSNTLEVLESTPGLYVDPDGGIYLSATTAAAIYINGREQKMSSQDIATILRSLPPNSVEKIEIIRTPSSKYDAASSGGIINVVLKKGVKLGRSGSVNAGMNQGKAGNRYAGFSINFSNDKTTNYLNVNFNRYSQFDELNSTRFLGIDTTLKQASEVTGSNDQVYIGFGSNYQHNEKTNFYFDSRINGTIRESESVNNNTSSALDYGILMQSNNLVQTDALQLSLQQDLGMTTKFDTLGSSLDLKLSYSYNSSGNDQDYNTTFYFPVNYLNSGYGSNEQDRHFLILQSDLTYQLPLKIKLETGLKSSWQVLGSNADYYVRADVSEVPDSKRTNRFNYTESINAFYIQGSRKLFGDLHLKTGFRMEHTYMDGQQQLPADTSFKINRADWFPYVYLSRRLFRIMGAELTGYAIYRKTISRPGYQELNPYSRYVDQFLSEAGNPALKPQFTDNFELNISFEDMPVFAIGRNITTDIFSSVMYHDEAGSEHLLRTYDNLGKNTETYFRGMIGIPPGGKYFFALGAQYNYNEYSGFYENEPMDYSRGSWRFFTFHSFTVHPNTKITANGFMMTNGQWNFYEMKNFGQLNIAVSQTFFDKKLSVSLNVRDILRTMETEFEFNQGTISSIGDRYTDNRRIGFNIRYNFGIRKKEENRNIPGFEEPEL
jgi:hypothetical protein